MFGTFMSTLDSSIVNIALPTIRRELNAGDRVEWIVLCYLLTTTSTLLIMGKLSDWVGRRQLYITGFLRVCAGVIAVWAGLESVVAGGFSGGSGAGCFHDLRHWPSHYQRCLCAKGAGTGPGAYGLGGGCGFQCRTGYWWVAVG